MGDAVPHRLTEDEYIALDRAAQTKSEFFDGVMYAMSGGSPRHNLVATNLARAIGVRLRGKPCIVVNSDQRVLVSETGLYTYPDVTIVCGGMKVHERFSDTMTNPTIVFEVLSPTTEAYDRGERFAQYRARESLREYVLVNPYEPFVEHYARAAHGEWVLRTVEGGTPPCRSRLRGSRFRSRSCTKGRISSRRIRMRRGLAISAPSRSREVPTQCAWDAHAASAIACPPRAPR
jgi:Uma2 family endonuclease